MWQKSFWSKNTLLAPLLQKLMSLERNSGPMTLHMFTIGGPCFVPQSRDHMHFGPKNSPQVCGDLTLRPWEQPSLVHSP